MKKPMQFTNDRPTTTITLKMPVDVLHDFENIAQAKAMSNAEALIQLYIGNGLRRDLEEFRRKQTKEQAKSILEKYHVEAYIIDEVIAAVR